MNSESEQKATKVTKIPPGLFFSYCPEDGIEFHVTAEEAEARAERARESAEFNAADSDWHWTENEDQVSWGQVFAKGEFIDRDPTPEEQEENPDWGFVRHYTLENVKPNPWIPVGVSLPDEGMSVLACNDEEDVGEAYLEDGAWWWSANCSCPAIDRITHWMDLPEPPVPASPSLPVSPSNSPK